MDAEFRQVIDAFKAKAGLTADELQEFQISNIGDVSTALVAIQHKQAKRRRLVFLKRIDPFLRTMTEFGKVVEVFLNSSDILGFVWGPLKLILTTTSSFSDAFNSLIETYQHIGEQVPLLESCIDLFSTHRHMRKLLVMIYEDVLSFHAIALRYFRQKSWKQFFRSNWKGFTSEIDLLKNNIQRHKLLIESRASLIEFETIQSVRASAEAGLREAKETEARRQKAAVFEWLSSPNIEAIQERHTITRSANPDSCRWILGDERFRRWFDPDYCSNPLLWINGKPGAGKSVLASMVIEEARKLQKISVAYFYCSFGDPERDGFLPLVRALLTQLLIQNDSLLLYLEEKMSKSGAHGVLSSLTVAQEILKAALESRKTFLVLDGIDECGRDQRKDICTWFKDMIESLPPSEHGEIRCLFVSQDDGIARKDLSKLPSISITSSLNKADITTFTRHWQARIEEKFGPLTECGPNLMEVVPARSQGIFIFAKCVLEELYQQPSREHLLREWSIERFPSELEQVYDRILHRLLNAEVETKKEIIKKLLSWVSFCKRPLRWFEIQAAISIELENDNINENSRRLVDTCKDLCASFVEVHSDQTVELVHSTVREFFRKQKTIDEWQVDLELCLLSVGYLNFPDFSTRFAQSSVEVSLFSGRYAFYEYAVACWSLHLMSWLGSIGTAQPSIAELQEMLEPFLQRHFVYGGSGVHTVVSKAMHEKLLPLQSFQLYDALAQAIIWSRKQLLAEADNNTRTTTNALDFDVVTSRTRSTLEDLARDGLTIQQEASLELYYGHSCLFKCPKIFCRHFTHGFMSREDRDRHVNRHERSYTCTFESCPMAIFGCLSLKELEKHMLESHGILADDDEFPRVSRPSTTPTAQNTERHTFQCSRCPKRFTRSFNLRAHERAHTDERPYACPVCGLAFARAHDQQTHTKRQCSEKKFRCRGNLQTGAHWGCGRGFAEAADFARHLRSVRGRRCIGPLVAEQKKEDEAEERKEAERRQALIAYHQTGLRRSNLLFHRSQALGESSSSLSNWETDGESVNEDAMQIDSVPSKDDEVTSASLPRALIAQYPVLAAFSQL